MEAASLPQLKNIGAVKSDMVADEEKDSEVPDWFSSYDKKKEERETIERLKAELKKQNELDIKLKRLREEHVTSLRWKQKRKVSFIFYVSSHSLY